ncbi:MAG: hypothetical protein U1E24_03945, partial [Phenylobacterium sp.]|nr:hypothetical protein [Phenylobacterium sp.]
MISARKQDLGQLISALAERQARAAQAVVVARGVGAQDLVILLRDPELDIVRPAPGFPQTLAGGPTWAELLSRCEQPGIFQTTV